MRAFDQAAGRDRFVLLYHDSGVSKVSSITHSENKEVAMFWITRVFPPGLDVPNKSITIDLLYDREFRMFRGFDTFTPSTQISSTNY
jgi:hypothetical protein